MALTDAAIRNAKPGERPVKLFDERGLYLEVSPSGGRWWRLKFRFGGKEKRLSLGVYPDVNLKEARNRRDEARKLLANGIDPSENRKVQKPARNDRAANSFELVAREWFAKHSPNWAATHASKIIQRLEKKAPCGWRPWSLYGQVNCAMPNGGSSTFRKANGAMPSARPRVITLFRWRRRPWRSCKNSARSPAAGNTCSLAAIRKNP